MKNLRLILVCLLIAVATYASVKHEKASYTNEERGMNVPIPDKQESTDINGFERIAAISSGIEPNHPNVNTPQMASIMKYIDHPVELCYGLVNIDIPLYELEFDGITIPLSISYHSSGLKTKEDNGPLGNGWSFSFGPSISRTINGMPDEMGGYLENSGYGLCTNLNSQYAFMEDVTDGKRDENPDSFYYKLLNKTGKFYFDRGDIDFPNNTPVVVTVPYEPIKIEHSGGRFLNFKIWDENGFCYNFDNTITAVLSDNNIIQWKTTRIVSPNNKILSLNYSQDLTATTINWALTDYICIEEVYDPSASVVSYPGGCSGLQDWPYISIKKGLTDLMSYRIDIDTNTGAYPAKIGSWGGCYNVGTPSGMGGTSSQIREKVLKSFETDNIRVEMDIATGTDQLRGIKITDKVSGKLIRNISFQQTTNGNKRRVLSSVAISDENNKLIEKYLFDYYNHMSIPQVGDKNTDHWGYYNGSYITAADVSVPRQDIKVNKKRRLTATIDQYAMRIGDAIKDPSLASTLTGVLKSITYPTGRKSIFTYELNQYRDYSDIENPVKNVGGLRIKEIEEQDPITGQTMKRKFQYNENGGGEMVYRITLDDYKYTKLKPINNECYRLTYYLSNPIPSLVYPGGATVFYSNVTEVRTNYSGKEVLGKTIYEYTPSNISTYLYPSTTLIIDNSTPWRSGKLQKRTDYKFTEFEGDFLYQPVRQETYNYSIHNSSTIKIAKTYKNVITSTDNPTDKQYLYEKYRGFIRSKQSIYNGCYKIISEKTEEFTFGIPSVITEKKYEYNNSSHLLSCIKETNSDGTETITSIKYPQDLSFTGGSTEEVARQKLIEKQQLTPPMEMVIQSGNKIWKNKVKYIIDPTSTLPLPKSFSKGLNGEEEERTEIKKYYSFGKAAWITIDDTSDIVYIWGYNKEKLIAEITNATFSQVTTHIAEATLNIICTRAKPTDSEWNSINELRSKLPASQVTTYKYDNRWQNLSGITDPSGITLYYEYDYAGRLNKTYYNENNEISKQRILNTYEYNYKTR